jgi:hypothetical protein
MSTLGDPLFGLRWIGYPPAASFFDCSGECALGPEGCLIPVEVWEYSYRRMVADTGPSGAWRDPSPAEVATQPGAEIDYPELCQAHHQEWFTVKYEEWTRRRQEEVQ